MKGKNLVMANFKTEKEFENALIGELQKHGWSGEVLYNPTQEDLLDNWADILFKINSDKDRLNSQPLTKSEMNQILEQINNKTPLALNYFINGGSVAIKRDNPNDTLHCGKEVSLKIFSRNEIYGQNFYQIARQPKFEAKSKILPDRRGDLTLLINGMPLIHIELKNNAHITEAVEQIKKYKRENIFSGLFSLVQIFVAMKPDETLYFANPENFSKFNPDYFFHWADFNNEPINEWNLIASSLLNIPMAHYLIGFYTISDEADGALKVLRSYQYYAINQISNKVRKIRWGEKNQLGGYIWHTTGSGKTMTSFKTAELISFSKDADKVVFLVDRIELGTQSLKEYRNFAGGGLSETQKQNIIQETEDTYVLLDKLKSQNPADTLIVTSIQKMSILAKENITLKGDDLDKINNKRIVFIVDEAHRSTFGDMFLDIKKAMPNAIFFGFTGTPIHDENKKKMNTTTDIFGDELHRYSIADGIRDKNVLGFDPYKVMTFKDKDLRLAVALRKIGANSVAEIFGDSEKEKIYDYYMKEATMQEIEKFLTPSQFFDKNNPDNPTEHQKAVVSNIIENWISISRDYKFHAILATNSIPEAIVYYRLFKQEAPNLKVTALFDKNIDNVAGFEFKEDGLVEIIEDYNRRYGQNFSISNFAKMKKDIAARLAHKKPHQHIGKDQEIDLLIVVNQMLTGFDSKWINALYLDKVIEYESIIQAFSRTNRLFGTDKPFGTIKYYRKPHTMEIYIEKAVKLYSGDKEFSLFADKLPNNIKMMNSLFEQIRVLFENAGIVNFATLPDDGDEVGKFVKLFIELNRYLEAAKIQGFVWNKLDYEFVDENGNKAVISLSFDETTYQILAERYNEILRDSGDKKIKIPFNVKGYISEIDTGKIDNSYMNSRFQKYIKSLEDNANKEQIQALKEELHKSFAILSQNEQKYAKILLDDIEAGNIKIDSQKDIREYINQYISKDEDDKIRAIVDALGVDENKLKNMLNIGLNESNINEYGRFDDLKSTVDKARAKEYFEKKENRTISLKDVNQKATKMLKDFIISGKYELG